MRIIGALAVILGLALTGGEASARSKCGETLFKEDFSQPGPDFNAFIETDRNVELRFSGENGVLLVTYAGNDEGSQRVNNSFELSRAVTEATLTFDVRFDSDFQFVQGGKLHGLGPDKPIVGGRDITPEGWSARVMWREEGWPQNYIYHQNLDGRYGEHGRRVSSPPFRKGRWQSVSLHVKLNTEDGEEGTVQLFVNGKRVETFKNLTFRKIFDTQSDISRFMFATFHGGSSPDWAPHTQDGEYATVRALFDNFEVREGRCIRKRPSF